MPGTRFRPGRLASAAAVALLKVYRAALSPWLPRTCRFHPSCSTYALGAFRTFGFGRALLLTVRRLLRCHPFHPGGFDPLPEPGIARSPGGTEGISWS